MSKAVAHLAKDEALDPAHLAALESPASSMYQIFRLSREIEYTTRRRIHEPASFARVPADRGTAAT